jgi:hypothetical protein
MISETRQKMGDMTERMRERRTEGRLDDLDRENVRLRTEVSQLRGDLDHERSLLNDALDGLRSKPTVVKKKRRGGLVRTTLVGGGAYLLGTRAGRERYDQIMGWVDRTRRDMTHREDEWSSDATAMASSPTDPSAPTTPAPTTPSSTPMSSSTRSTTSKTGATDPASS